ncbi:hypothetical protein [uncultured Kordia sp.]|uniref:hypothetical protein n=1 Tax=uncultured Kordia sp. TaxID=507699 RepID=UPI0026134BC0|nr:hypothetical protein [uncultured Kordia sp.]
MSSPVVAQNTSDENLDQYNELLNYIPKNLTIDTIYRPDHNFLKKTSNSIGGVSIYYNYKANQKLSDDDRQWLEQRIEKLATALFHDGVYILLGKTGGASGCPTNKLLDTIQLKIFTITKLKFCYTCTIPDNYEKLIEIFNAKMYDLMQLRPPDFKTHRFYGTYEGKGKHHVRINLVLTKDRTFKFWENKSHHRSDFTQGFWENRNDTLVLQSKKLSQADSIDFNTIKFKLKRNKLIGLEREKWKLKRIE